MLTYTDSLSEEPRKYLNALSICLGGEWVEYDERVGFHVTHDNSETDVELDLTDETLSVVSQGMHVLQWSAPLSTCKLTQQIDDGQLFTELQGMATDDSGADRRLSVWGPAARYRGGPIKLRDPTIDESNYIISEIVKRFE